MFTIHASNVVSLVLHGPRLRAALDGESDAQCPRWIFVDVERVTVNGAESWGIVLRGEDKTVVGKGKQSADKAQCNWCDDTGAYRPIILGTSDDKPECDTCAVELLAFLSAPHADHLPALGSFAAALVAPICATIYGRGGMRALAGGACGVHEREAIAAKRAAEAQAKRDKDKARASLLKTDATALESKLTPDQMERVRKAQELQAQKQREIDELLASIALPD